MSEKLARAVLLFHRGGPWTEADRATWLELTGSDEATTVTLCDLARRIAAEDHGMCPHGVDERWRAADDVPGGYVRTECLRCLAASGQVGLVAMTGAVQLALGQETREVFR